MYGIIKHTLKGIPGWSKLSIETIDVEKVIQLNYKKRLFMITNREYPYTLNIKYENIHNEMTLMPTIPLGKGSMGMTPVFYTETESIITKRYKTKQDIINEIDEIKTKQENLKKIAVSLEFNC